MFKAGYIKIAGIKQGLSILLLAACSTPVAALELSTMVSDSINAHPQVKEKIHVYRQVMSDQAIAQSGWRPSVDLEASTGLYTTDSPATGNTALDYDSSRLELSVTQNLFNGYNTTNQIKQTRARATAALYDLYDTADNVALDAIQAYFAVLKQRRLYELATENVASHEGILAQIRVRNSSGVGRRSQLQQTEGRVARAHASQIAQQNNLQDSLTLLHQILGRYVDPAELQTAELPVLPRDDLNRLIEQALRQHPAMKVAMSNIDASLADYRRSRSSLYPNIDLRLASEWGDDFSGVPGSSEELSLVLNLSYNLYRGGADKAQQQQKISASYEQKEFAARVRRQIINTLRLAWVADESLTRQLGYLKTHIAKTKETAISYKEEFFIGQRDLVDLLDAESETNVAQNQYAEAYYDSLVARYRVYEGLGLLFEALNLKASLSADNLQLVGINAQGLDSLPLPGDEDRDNKIDWADHCDNSAKNTVIGVYGCQLQERLEAVAAKPNTSPVAVDDEIVVDSNSVILITSAQLLANDSDADLDPLQIVSVGKPSKGRLSFNQDKNLIYRPNEGFTGLDSFTYTITDGKGGNASATAVVNLVVRQEDSLDLAKRHYVNFKYKKSELTEVSKSKVQSIVEKIKQASKVRIEVYTYTDSIGSQQYNLALSQRRADALKALLVSQGIGGKTITAIGRGESNPIADNATEAGRAINRRGEFVFKAEGIQ